MVDAACLGCHPYELCRDPSDRTVWVFVRQEYGHWQSTGLWARK